MKKIIYRNLATDCVKFFLLTIFTISTIIWVLQAVNYLDFVIEDGHGFFVYFNYNFHCCFTSTPNDVSQPWSIRFLMVGAQNFIGPVDGSFFT